jgi:hypothetical protein
MHPTADDIAAILSFFAPFCRETSTFSRLQVMVADRTTWRNGHALFQQIRAKTLKADDTQNERFQHQYSLEEICAKTLFNMSYPQPPFNARHPAPFDEDSPDFVGPIAKQFSAYLGVEVPECIAKLT